MALKVRPLVGLDHLETALSLILKVIEQHCQVARLDGNSLSTPFCTSLDFDTGTVRTVGIRKPVLGREDPLPTVYPTEHDLPEKPDKLVPNTSVFTSWVYFNGKDILLVLILRFLLSLPYLFESGVVNVGG